MRIDIYGDCISYITDEVSTIPVTESNLNEENRIKFVTDLAAVSRGKDASNNPAKRYASLLEEAAPTAEEIDMTDRFTNDGEKKVYKKKSSRPIEFMPVVIKYIINMDGEDPLIELYDTKGNQLMDDDEALSYSFMQFSNMIARHSYIQGNNIYTNMRCLLNAMIPYDSIPYNTPEELKDFKAIKANIPMFIWNQVPNTHTAISKEAQSDRVAENTNYWLPEDFRDRLYYLTKDGTENGIPIDPLAFVTGPGIFKLTNGHLIGQIQQARLLSGNNIINELLNMTQTDVVELFKILGYHREIWSRAMYYFKYKEVVMTGWNNDPKVWEHLFLERSVRPEINKNWTQNETKTFVMCMDQIINQK